jgi:hypothetical protein
MYVLFMTLDDLKTSSQRPSSFKTARQWTQTIKPCASQLPASSHQLAASSTILLLRISVIEPARRPVGWKLISNNNTLSVFGRRTDRDSMRKLKRLFQTSGMRFPLYIVVDASRCLYNRQDSGRGYNAAVLSSSIFRKRTSS